MAAPLVRPAPQVKVVVGTEDRQPSADRGIGRLRKAKIGTYQFCTATLVSLNCALTAAHCSPVFGVVEFDLEIVPNQFRWAKPENLFEIDRQRSVLSAGEKGDDWAVLRLKPNRVTKSAAGTDRPIYHLSQEPAVAQQSIVVTGYGAADNLYSFSQQRGPGVVTQVVNGPTESPTGYLEHDADTGGGSSGAAVFDAATRKIIGVHTLGDSEREINSATLTLGNETLNEALLACEAAAPSPQTNTYGDDLVPH